MSNDLTVHDALAARRLLAILRYRDGGDILGALRALAAGGVTIAEVTVHTPGWQDAVTAAADAGVLAGAGTVTRAAEVADAHAAGARFVVSPGFVPAVVRAALDLGVEPLPGVTTATEILAARDAGVRLFKLFPAGALGLDYLRQLRGPFPETAFVPTGGVGVGTIGEWLAAGAFAVALGSELAGRAAPRTGAERAELTSRAGAAVAASRQARVRTGHP
jgi:2-dehydro-3-deoxyphosphogluconate aldolase / (4S)-4-hydroxy-2-oxoglutarate aldolase